MDGSPRNRKYTTKNVFDCTNMPENGAQQRKATTKLYQKTCGAYTWKKYPKCRHQKQNALAVEHTKTHKLCSEVKLCGQGNLSLKSTTDLHGKRDGSTTGGTVLSFRTNFQPTRPLCGTDGIEKEQNPPARPRLAS